MCLGCLFAGFAAAFPRAGLLIVWIFTGVSQALVAQAEIVVHWAPDLADRLLAGTLGLDGAYTDARQRMIARELSLSMSTVNSPTHASYAKLDAKAREAAARCARSSAVIA